MFQLNRRSVALSLGVVYLAIGALGLVSAVPVLGIFGASPLLSALHVAIGLIAIWSSQARAEARPLATGLVALFALLVGGAFVAPMAAALGLTSADTLLHLVSLVLVAYVGIVEREVATA